MDRHPPLAPAPVHRPRPVRRGAEAAPAGPAIRGQFTQRIFEAVLAGCVPLAPADLRAVETVVPPELIARDAEAARAVLHWLTATAGGPEHAELIGRCLRHLAPFRLSRQLTVLDRLLNQAIFSHEVTR